MPPAEKRPSGEGSKSETSDEKDLRAKTQEWLDSQGYPLELLVGREFHRAGWRVRHSHVYDDPREDNTREIDLLASRNVDGPDISASIELAIECKATSKPWVIFSSNSNAPYPSARWLVPGRIQTAALGFYQKKAGPRLPLSLLDSRPRVGHGIAMVSFGKGDDNATRGSNFAYRALLSATTAAGVRTREYDYVVSQTGGLDDIRLTLPIVVLNGTLFELTLGDEGDPVLRDIASAKVLFEHGKPIRQTHIVNVVTMYALPNFIQAATRDLDQWGSALLFEGKGLIDKLRRSVENAPNDPRRRSGGSSDAGR